MRDFALRANSYEGLSRWVTDDEICGVPVGYLKGLEPLGSLLDAGGGTGYLSWLVSRAVAADAITVVDESSAMLEICSGRMRAAELVCSSVEEYCRSCGRMFDAVLCRQLLHYVDDPLEVLTLLGGLLAPGGIVYVGQFAARGPAADEWHAWLVRRISPSRRRSFTREGLRELLERAGFEVAEARFTPYEENIADFCSRGVGMELGARELAELCASRLTPQAEHELSARVDDGNMWFTVDFCHLFARRRGDAS